MNILLTGYTGNLGAELARQLVGHRVYALVRSPHVTSTMPHVAVIPGTLEALPNELASEIELIVHSAALTAFRAPLEELRRTNVAGTCALLDFARKCPRLRRFIHLSTTCVAGDRQGRIAEERIVPEPAFVNDYERSKWEAEELVLDSGLPVEIARLAIVAGSELDGSVLRPGALHRTLYWLYHGLVPMMPGTPDSRVDIISTEFAAGVVGALVNAPAQSGRIVHATMGESAPRLDELLDFLTTLFARHHRGWARGSVARPDIVDATTFGLFEEAARQSGDAIFRRVCDDARLFLPGLLHPRFLALSLAAEIPAIEWRTLAGRVFTWLHAHEWGRQPEILHAA